MKARGGGDVGDEVSGGDVGDEVSGGGVSAITQAVYLKIRGLGVPPERSGGTPKPYT